MADSQPAQDQQPSAGAQAPQAAQPAVDTRPQHDDTDGLKGKKPEELTAEELRLMADTMPGDGPGD